MSDPLIFGVPVVVLTPGLVEILKRSGLPARYAGAAAIICATVLAGLADIAGIAPVAGGGFPSRMAFWILAGIVYGLAAAGLYAQGRIVTTRGNRGEPSPRLPS